MKLTLPRILCLLLALLLLAMAAVGCKKKTEADSEEEKGKEEALEENEIRVTWHLGAMHSADDPLHAEQLVPGEAGYSYTDIITVPKKGTLLTFADDNNLDAADGKTAQRRLRRL